MVVDWVCAACGATCAQSRSGRWVHTDGYDAKIEAHDARPEHASVLEEAHYEHTTLRGAAQDMMRHHGTLHPDSDCEWARNLSRALSEGR